MKQISLMALLVLAASICALPAQAADDKADARMRDQLHRLQMSLRKSEQEKSGLEMEKSALDEQLKAATEKVGDMEKSLKRIPALTRQLAAMRQERDDEKKEYEARLTDGDKRYAALGDEQKKAVLENAQLRSQQAKLKGQLDDTEAKNLQLYKYSLALMDKYRTKSVFGCLAQAEPFTGLKQIEIDNLLDEYREKVDAQKVQAPAE